MVVLGKGNRFRKALAGNGVVREWFMKHDSLEVTSDGISHHAQTTRQSHRDTM